MCDGARTASHTIPVLRLESQTPWVALKEAKTYLFRQALVVRLFSMLRLVWQSVGWHTTRRL